MDRILKQRDRLLGISARLVGLVCAGTSFVLLVLTDPRPGLILIVAPGYAVLAFALARLGATKSLLWPPVVVIAGLTTTVLVRLGTLGAFDPVVGLPAPFTIGHGAVDAVRLLVAGSVASISIVLMVSLGRMIMLASAFIATLVTAVTLFSGPHEAALGIVAWSVLAGWFGLALSGAVLSAGVLRAARRVSSIGRAHRSERQASETEAQRRQGARLLHDTVLATLTLLAHSGVGVSKEALRRQAGDDARLLRQLRLSPTPISMSAGKDEAGKPNGTTVRSDSLEAVRTRFERLGLDVSWHGAGTVSLRPDRLDAFLLALSECLENVRRHSGLSEAHVTITDDEATVRALVTDNGVGFEPAAVPAGKLGYRESIVGRLEEAGGTARVFSAQGSGTTVVLEMPR